MVNMNEELMAKARGAKSVEELLALAKENNVELTEEEANAYFEQMNRTGELEDDELDSVAGGGCGNKKSNDNTIVDLKGTCSQWTCWRCLKVGKECSCGNKEPHICENCNNLVGTAYGSGADRHFIPKCSLRR